jgi:GMP synthase-like glutamine amidotransferase
MCFILIDNTNDIESAKMTPMLISFFKKRGIELQIYSNQDTLPTLRNIKGIILSGGPMLLSNETYLKDYIINFNILINYPHIPIFGICFGFQVIAMAYGGHISKLPQPILGLHKNISILKDSVLFKSFPNNTINVYKYHNDHITRAPHHFHVTAYDNTSSIQVIENKELLRFGTQFHPENSRDGEVILNNFLDFCINR